MPVCGKETGMDYRDGMVMIGGACILVMLVAAMRSRTELLLNFILRAVCGLLAIYFINSFLGSAGISVRVGIGLASAVISGALGIPGIALLYAVGICARLLA